MNSRVNSRDFRLTITWCSCWPYGIAPRAEENFSAPCAEPEVDGRTMANPGFFCQPRVLLSTSFVQLLSGESSYKNPLGSMRTRMFPPLLVITAESCQGSLDTKRMSLLRLRSLYCLGS